MNAKNEEYISFFQERARKAFLKDGFHSPVMFELKQGRFSIFIFETFDDAMKDKVADLMRTRLNEGAECIFLVHESWWCILDANEEVNLMRYREKFGSIKGYNHTQECLSILYRDRHEMRVYIASILRSNDKLDLGEWSLIKGGQTGFRGRFSNNNETAEKNRLN